VSEVTSNLLATLEFVASKTVFLLSLDSSEDNG